MPKSGWTIEEAIVAAVTSAVALARSRPRWAISEGSSAGTAPWQRSAQPWAKEKGTIARRSIGGASAPRPCRVSALTS